MSHLVLARKWRPRNFAEVVGQEHVVRALSNALEQGRLHHAYLFSGTRGVGKTTLARILAKCLNCDSGPTPTPCGTCPACRDIEAGRFVDLIEIDAASYTGVDNMREVLENAQYAPTSGRYKVYIIDEVHMLSKSAFNAMLKTLEEPPAHVVFVLATTDPQKVPVTVLSRCLQFNLKLMPPARITEHLRRVLDGEQVQYEPGALNLLARAAAGSMRDALSLTDQAIAYGGGGLGEEETQAMLGVIDQAYLYPILEALADGDGARLMTEADRIASRSLSFDAALQDLSALVYQIGLAQTLPEAVSEDVPERERLFALAHRLDAETAQLFYQIACLGRRDLDWAPDEQTGFAMTLLRMLAFTPDNAGREASAEAPGTSGRGHTGSRAGRPGEVTTPASAAPLRPETGPTGDKAAGDLPDWIGLTRRLSGGAKQLASQCELVAWDGKRLKLRLHEEQKPLVSSFGDRLRVALGEHLAAGLDVEFEFGATAGTTPAQAASRENERRQSEAEAAIQNDPFVQAMVQGFEAKVSDIKPLQ